MMDNLGDIYYLVQLIGQQILIFLQDFIFREFTCAFTSAKDTFDNANSKILDDAPQHSAIDFFVLFTVCGLLFTFMILSAPKIEASNHDICNIETISTTFENNSPPLWYSKAANLNFINYFHAYNSINLSRDMILKEQNISHSAFSKCKMSLRSKTSNSVRSIHSQHSQKTQMNYPTSQTIVREWLIRRTRSGHVYGKYPI
ncbi:uncharacterized protein [Anoplolepis gracilipes]|uniref:uncharacterized protein n=1 Tax=Anoplolepis gracilipes TaxID=354296 RepID=UPI003BA12F26